LSKADPEKSRTHIFLRLCSEFGVLQDFLDTIKDKEKKGRLLRELIFGLKESEDVLRQAVYMAETLVYIYKVDQETRQMLESLLEEAYTAQDEGSNLQKLYGIIASTYQGQAISSKDFFTGLREKYPIKETLSVGQEELVNADGEIIQRHFFYNDSDGKSSYAHFMKRFSPGKGWSVTDKDSYVRIEKQNRASGVKTIIFANKPEHDDSDDADEEMQEHDLSSVIIVHRGHSYHASKTIKRIPSTARIVVLGSCGGFINTSKTLGKSPGASIIATKGEGTMMVNDQLLGIIDDEMLAGKGVNWPTLWDKVESRIKDTRLQQYIPPHRNIATQIIMAYEESNKPK
jgi:hypothetical protein